MMKEKKSVSTHKKWENYEVVTREIINKLTDIKDQLQLDRIEDKQTIKGKSGEEWEMEIVAYDSENGKPVLVDCKHWSKSRIPRDIMASFAYKIHDIGGERGIIVVSTDLQKGAKRIAAIENIEVIKLNYDATADRFDLVLRDRGQHHLGLGGVAKIKDEVTLIRLTKGGKTRKEK